MSTNIYILKLQGGRYYVGKTDNPMKRYQEHLNGAGSAWTRTYKPIGIEKIIPNASPFEEDRYVKEYMSKHGIEKVRGGAYMSTDLSEEQEDTLRNELRATMDKCLKCGKEGHFANQCKRRSSFTASCHCGKNFLDFEEYVAHQRLCMLRTVKKEEKDIIVCGDCEKEFNSDFAFNRHTCKPAKSYSKPSGTCYRCGRTGHYANDCYARTTTRGRYLDSDDD